MKCTGGWFKTMEWKMHLVSKMKRKLRSNYLDDQWITYFFIISTLFFNLASVLLNFFMNWTSTVAYVLLNTHKHHHVNTPFIFRPSDLSNPWSRALLHGLQPPTNLATRTFFLPSTNWIIVDCALWSAMGFNNRKYLQNTTQFGEVINPMHNGFLRRT